MMVVSLKDIFHCALFLIVCLFSVAGIFILLDAEFLAVAQVLIYVGAVAILMIFAVMLTSNLASREIRQTNENSVVTFFVCLIFLMATLTMLYHTDVWNYAREQIPATESNTMMLGKLLMTKFMLPFEVVSVVLLAAMIGAIVLARKESA
jgi:NADH-quinone oxidoreductase subunit J